MNQHSTVKRIIGSTVLTASILTCAALAPGQPPAEAPAVRTDHSGDSLPAGAIARVGTLRFRAPASISQLALAPDGKTLATGSTLGFHIWNSATGKEIPSGDQAGMIPFTFARAFLSPDGRTLALGAQDRSIRLWDLAARRERRAITGPFSPVPHMSFSGDGALLAVMGNNFTIHMIEVATGKEVRQVVLGEVPQPGNGFIAFSPDAKTIASSSAKGTAVHLWDSITGKEVRQYQGHTAVATGMSFSPDGKILATASIDRSVRLWDVASGKELRRLAGSPLGSFHPITFSPDGKMLATSGIAATATIQLWETDTGKAVRSLVGHPLPGTTSLGFSPDGKTLLSAGNDQTVRQWDVTTGEQTALLLSGPGTQTFITALAYSPDSQHIALASSQMVRVREVATGKEIRQLTGHTGNVLAIAFSPNGKLLASMGNNPDPTTRLWDLATGKEIHRLQEPNFFPRSILFSPDGKMLAACTDAGVISIWDTATGTRARTLESGPDGVGVASTLPRRLAFSPDGKTLALVGRSRIIRHWDLGTDEKPRQIAGRFADARMVRFSSDGKTLIVIGTANTVHMLELAGGREIRQFPFGTPFQSTAMDFSGDGQTLATGQSDGSIRLWDVSSGKEQTVSMGWRAPVHRVAFQDGSHLVTMTNDRRFEVTQLATGKTVSRFTLDEPGIGFAFAVSPDGQRAAFTGTLDRSVWIVEAATGKKLPIRNAGAFTALAFSPDGKRLAGVANDHIVIFWDALTGEEAGQLVCRSPQSFAHVLFAPDGQTVLLANTTQMVVQYAINSGRELRRFSMQPAGVPIQPGVRPTGSATSMALSRDGRVLASGTTGGVIQLWETATGKERFRLTDVPNTIIRSMVFSADGRTLISSGERFGNVDHAIRFWDVDTGKEAGTLTGHRGFVMSLAMSPDGKTLASGSIDATALLWDVSSRVVKARPVPVQLAGDQLEKAWDELANGDGLKGHQAVRLLAAGGEQTVPFLKTRLQPVSATAERITRLIGELDSNQFDVREKAVGDLQQLGELAEKPLRAALLSKPPLEVRTRIETLLYYLDTKEATPDECRNLRAIEVLEEIATADARQVLHKLAQGTQEARVTREAKAALDRLAQRRSAP